AAEARRASRRARYATPALALPATGQGEVTQRVAQAVGARRVDPQESHPRFGRALVALEAEPARAQPVGEARRLEAGSERPPPDADRTPPPPPPLRPRPRRARGRPRARSASRGSPPARSRIGTARRRSERPRAGSSTGPRWVASTRIPCRSPRVATRPTSSARCNRRSRRARPPPGA